MATAQKTAPRPAPKTAAKVVPIDEAAPEPVPPPRRAKKKLLVVALAIVLIALSGGGAWYAVSDSDSDPDSKASAEPKAEPIKAPVYLPMEAFTVNLLPETGEQYLQIAFTLQVADQAQIDQIKLYMPLVRSRLLLLLTSKKPSELSDASGKQKLQEEIIAKLSEPFTPKGAPVGVTGVHFTAFVIQ